MRDPLHELDKEIPPVKGEAAPSPVTSQGEDQGAATNQEIAGQDTSAPGRTLREPKPPTANVAVVFVHGMGTSKPGDMLEGYMNPSLEWIKRATTDDHNWYKNNDPDLNLFEGVNILERNRKHGASPATGRAPVQANSQSITDEVDIASLPKALLQSTASTPAVFQPSYIDVDLVRKDDTSEEIRKLVAVEAWWDGEFNPPPFRLVANWALGVAPSLILRHLALIWERDPGADAHTLSVSRPSPPPPPSISMMPVKLLNALAFTIVGGLIAILFQWTICLLLAIGFVPFLQKYASAIILKMTTSFGDVLTYVHDGVRSAAIRSTVMRTFLWLHDHYTVEKLIVIGHSLGSVVSYDVLNSRDLLAKVAQKDVSFVTFGSPLKKTSLLLQLRRDEQRTSLGMMFAWLSLLCAIAAMIAGMNLDAFPDSGPLNRWQWLFIATTGIGAVALGMGAHARPRPARIPGIPYGLNLSLAQYLGLLLALSSAIVLIFNVSTGWIALPVLIAIGFGAWAIPVSFSRLNDAHDPYRMSQFLGFGLLFLGLIACAGVAQFLHPVACFLVAALVLSVLTGANPLEEFGVNNGVYTRQMPKFSFGTPIRQWIDFWATNDLVAEFGLGDVLYSPTPDGVAELRPISRRVTNMRSYLADHTSYRQNLEQFIAPLTRLFLEEIGFRNPDNAAGQTWGRAKSFLGYTPVQGRYEQDITNAMRSRASRMRWLSWANSLLLLSMLLLAPGVYRSIGEYIVFDERNPVSISGAGEPAQGPAWFTTFYNSEPKVCGDILCRIRHIPFVPDDVSENLIRGTLTGNAILYGLGYGLVFAVVALLTRAFLLSPWKAWESSILDTLLQKKTSPSFNRIVRTAMFALAALATAALAFWIHAGYWGDWLGSAWLWDQDLTPAQTIWRFVRWIMAPFIGS